MILPEEGFDTKLDAMYHWMDTEAGRGNWGINSDNAPVLGLFDAVSFYMNDPALPPRLIDRFQLELALADSERA